MKKTKTEATATNAPKTGALTLTLPSMKMLRLKQEEADLAINEIMSAEEEMVNTSAVLIDKAIKAGSTADGHSLAVLKDYMCSPLSYDAYRIMVAQRCNAAEADIEGASLGSLLNYLAWMRPLRAYPNVTKPLIEQAKKISDVLKFRHIAGGTLTQAEGYDKYMKALTSEDVEVLIDDIDTRGKVKSKTAEKLLTRRCQPKITREARPSKGETPAPRILSPEDHIISLAEWLGIAADNAALFRDCVNAIGNRCTHTSGAMAQAEKLAAIKNAINKA